jgi:phosphoglycerate dehydrogenase-like enzyme
MRVMRLAHRCCASVLLSLALLPAWVAADAAAPGSASAIPVPAAATLVPAPTPAPATATLAPDVAAAIERLGLEESATPVRDRAGWQPPKKVVVLAAAPGVVSAFKTAAPGVELLPATSAAEAAVLARDADAVIGSCTPDVLAAGSRIRWVQTYSAGVERCIAIPAVRERGILLTNMQRVAGPVMAEHVMAMMLAFARGLHLYIPERMAARWSPQLPEAARLLTLEGKTVLVVGLGGIGTEVARRAHAFGMRVIATRASSREGPPFVDYVGLPEELAALAGKADFVVNTTPLTPATRGLFDAKLFAATKPGAFFVNVGRGGSVVQPDLVAALRSGHLAGAGLDVTDPEPLPADSPLWQMQNVIITPHVSAESDLGNDLRFLIAAENLRRYVAGEKMLSVVDVGKGY